MGRTYRTLGYTNGCNIQLKTLNPIGSGYQKMDLCLVNCEDVTGFTLLRIKSGYVVCEFCGVPSVSVKAGKLNNSQLVE